jgi:hypothetical protein
MYKSDTFIPDDLHLIDQPEATQVVPQLLFRDALVQSAQINISTGVALRDCQGDLCGDRARLPPADLQFLAMEREFFDGSVSVECCGCVSVQEGKKNARFFGEDAYGLEGTEMDEIEKLVYGGCCRKVADVNGTPRGGGRGGTAEIHGGSIERHR